MPPSSVRSQGGGGTRASHWASPALPVHLRCFCSLVWCGSLASSSSAWSSRRFFRFSTNTGSVSAQGGQDKSMREGAVMTRRGLESKGGRWVGHSSSAPPKRSWKMSSARVERDAMLALPSCTRRGREELPCSSTISSTCAATCPQGLCSMHGLIASTCEYLSHSDPSTVDTDSAVTGRRRVLVVVPGRLWSVGRAAVGPPRVGALQSQRPPCRGHTVRQALLMQRETGSRLRHGNGSRRSGSEAGTMQHLEGSASKAAANSPTVTSPLWSMSKADDRQHTSDSDRPGSSTCTNKRGVEKLVTVGIVQDAGRCGWKQVTGTPPARPPRTPPG